MPMGWGGREGVPVVTLAGTSSSMGRVPKTQQGYQGLTAGEMGWKVFCKNWSTISRVPRADVVPTATSTLE